MSVAPDGLALLASGLWGTSDFVGGSLSRRLRTAHVVVTSQACAAVLVVAAVAALGVRNAPGGWQTWSVLAGVTWAAAMGAFYSALAMGSMSVVAPIASTGAAVPVVVGLLQGERPGGAAAGGIVVAILGVAAASRSAPDGGDRHRAAVGLALLTAVLFGVETWCLAQGSRASVPMTLVGMRLTALACTAAVLVPTRRPGRHRAAGPRPQRRDLPALAGLGVLDALATAAYAVAASGGLLSLVAVLASLYPAVTVLLARRVHGERLTRVQGAGVLGVLLGVACIARSAL